MFSLMTWNLVRRPQKVVLFRHLHQEAIVLHNNRAFLLNLLLSVFDYPCHDPHSNPNHQHIDLIVQILVGSDLVPAQASLIRLENHQAIHRIPIIAPSTI